MNVSVFVQTLNEEENLPRCLDSLRWSDDIVVLDSFSSDRTEEVARSYGARFYQREYDGRASNQNWAVVNIDFCHPWVWYVDADEVTRPELAREVMQVCSATDRPEVAFSVQRDNVFQGKLLRHGGMRTVRIIRLWRPECIRWSRAANPVADVDGPVGRLQRKLLHFFFSKGLAEWIARHNKYSSYEADETIRALQIGDVSWTDLFSLDPMKRRQTLKELSFRMPCRPWLKFLYMYVLRRGFLDGRAGLTYCTLQSIYEYMICLKVRELKRDNR